jgi:hypothetical protein
VPVAESVSRYNSNEFVAACQFPLSQQREADCRKKIKELVSSGIYKKTFSHDMNGPSAISYMQ